MSNSVRPDVDLPPFLEDTPPGNPLATLVLAHGAGAAMDSPFMNDMAERLSAKGIRVLRFEFPYMRTRRKTGQKKPPDRAPILEATWAKVVAHVGTDAFIGGKSMGGRYATLMADELGVRGVVALGYPFHPLGKPDKLRTDHLEDGNVPVVICQGTRDTMGTQDEVEGYALGAHVDVVFIEDGDHSLKPRKKSGRTLDDNLDDTADAVFAFVRKHA